MRSISPLVPLPYDGEDTRPSSLKQSLNISRWAMDWLSSGSVPPMSLLTSTLGRVSAFLQEGMKASSAAAASRIAGVFMDYSPSLVYLKWLNLTSPSPAAIRPGSTLWK